jgi:hypothetical protein
LLIKWDLKNKKSTYNIPYPKRLNLIKIQFMKQFTLIFITLLFSCKSEEYLNILKLGEELGCSGSIGIYRTIDEYPQENSIKKYLELQLNCPNLFEKYDTISLQNIAAYRLFIKLDSKDKMEYEAIRVVFKNDIKSRHNKTNFISMSILERIYNSELIVREYFKALKNNDHNYLKKAFDSEEFGYSNHKIDSINKSFLEITKGKLDESRLYNWLIVDDENKKYKLLVFLTDSENNYSTKFQFALHDSLKCEKNIVSIKF